MMTSYLSQSFFPLGSGNIISSHKRMWKYPNYKYKATETAPEGFALSGINKGSSALNKSLKPPTATRIYNFNHHLIENFIVCQMP